MFLAAFAALLPLQAAALDADADNALGTAGLSIASARFDSNLALFYGETEFKTPFFRAVNENPWRLPFYAATLQQDIGAAASSPNQLFGTLWRQLGIMARRDLIGNPNQEQEAAAKKPGALQAVLGDLKRAGIIKTEPPVVAGVPAQVQEAAALVLLTASKSLIFRRQAVRQLGSVDEAFAFAAVSGDDDLEGENAARMRTLCASFDRSYMAAASQDLTLAVTKAEALIREVSPASKYAYSVDTTWGQIRLSGGSSDTISGPALLLSMDTGGDDTYIGGPRTASASNWLSVSLDSVGNDAYLSDPALKSSPVATWAGRKAGAYLPGPGGALLGFSFLVDSAGDDLYRSHLPSFGSGRFGCAFLWDRDGKDTYDARADSIGAGHMGVGVLMDDHGADSYACMTTSGGFGYVGGLGLLLDQEGDDTYAADNANIDYPSAQDAKSQNSMSLGAATGRRADYTDGHSLAGGIGILFDRKGNDTYSCGVFGEGVGYWCGVGMLWDSSGSDKYTGVWYTQGAAAHFAVGMLEDGAGDDSYTASTNMALGAGHDYSVGMLLERGGNDTYKGPNLSLGAGNANGIGIFVEFAGNDQYEAGGLCLGRAGDVASAGLRSRALCLGLFMDLSGTDKYPQGVQHAGDARRAANWERKGDRPWESQLGVYYDR